MRRRRRGRKSSRAELEISAGEFGNLALDRRNTEFARCVMKGVERKVQRRTKIDSRGRHWSIYRVTFITFQDRKEVSLYLNISPRGSWCELQFGGIDSDYKLWTRDMNKSNIFFFI